MLRADADPLANLELAADPVRNCVVIVSDRVVVKIYPRLA